MAIQVIHTDQDIFSLPAVAVINPVNLVGVMGAGLALQFKRRFPQVFYMYSDAIKDGSFKAGNIQAVYTLKDSAAYALPLPPECVINFPTKHHWKDPSDYELISLGLQALVTLVNQVRISSIAIPPLGCGCGGLDKEKILDMIHAEFLPFVRKYLNVCYLVRF